MNPLTRKHLDKYFEKGKVFLESQEALLNELTGTFEAELWESLQEQSFFCLGQKMALPLRPSLEQVINRQILFTWGLGYAVGSTSKAGDF